MKTVPPSGTAAKCSHCGTPFRPTQRESEFCCAGCRFVFHLLRKRGLEDFYRFGGNPAPASSGVFHSGEWSWLEDLQEATESGIPAGQSVGATVEVQGIACAGCVWLLEALFLEAPGAISCTVHSTRGTLRLEWAAGECHLVAYAADAKRFGYRIGPLSNREQPPSRDLTRRMGICGALALNAMLFALPRYLGLEAGSQLNRLFDVVSFFLATASLFLGGTHFFRRAFGSLRRHELHMDLPISIGLAVAYTGSVTAWLLGHSAMSYFDFVSIFTFLMLAGRWTQERSIEANRRRLLGSRLDPGRVKVFRDGQEHWVLTDARALRTGDRYQIEKSALVPVRSTLEDNAGTFALNWITGESVPRRFQIGQSVPAGARNLTAQPITLCAREVWEHSQLARLLAVEDSPSNTRPGFRTGIRAYIMGVIVIAILGGAAWGIAAGPLAAAQVFVSVLVVSCPCALGVALPLLNDAAALRLQAGGVYPRSEALWEKLRGVRSLVLDKTGTVTLDVPGLANHEALLGLHERARAVLLMLVADSPHPVAASLREALLSLGCERTENPDASVCEIPGMGLEWQGTEGTWRVGRARWAAPEKNLSGTVFSLEGVPLAAFSIVEELRTDAATEIHALRSRGFSVSLLSGDEPARVQSMAHTLGIPQDEAFGGMTPDEKAALIRSRWPDSALLLGDGANDSLAFDAARCCGTPSVESGLLEHKADFYLLGRSLRGLGMLFRVADQRRKSVRAVFAFALSYNTLAISAALAGWMSPLVAAIIMPTSSLLSISLVFLTFRVGGSKLLNPNHQSP